MNAIRSATSCLLICLCAGLSHAGFCIDNGNCMPGSYCEKQPGDCAGMGLCMPKPDLCALYMDPVCGCDGRTYSNPCFAAMAGVSVAYPGNCLPGGCTDNDDCSSGSYCAKATGDCDGKGECTAKPGVCPDVWHPVCGCDGKTYGNACEAAMAGVNISYEGECSSGGCKGNSDCDPDSWCAKAPGDCDGEGECKPRPDVCPDLWDPVCGCDGKTYSNECYAAMAGVNVAHWGACPSPACTDNSDCPGDSYCAKAAGDCDGTGQCQPRPDACIDLWDPVCGCDGQTYSNACYAAAAGVNVKYAGECGQCRRPQADLNGDCKVDLGDLAIMAAQWLTCGWSRAELCL